MRQVDTTHEECKRADEAFYASSERYDVLVAKCLQTVTTPDHADSLLMEHVNTVDEGLKGGYLPSTCANAITKLAR